MAGDLYLAGSILLGLGFMFYVVKLKYNNGLAMEVFIYSINYLIALFCFLLADHYILLIAPY